MTRKEEYEALQIRLEQIPRSDPVAYASKRLRRRHRLLRPVASAAAVFVVFVSLINMSPKVLAACREIPLLKELAEVLTFNPSLRVAIENDYVQMVKQQQTSQNVTARVEYLIVDQKQVNIFYRLQSEQYEALTATPELRDENGEHLTSIISAGGIGEDQEEIRKITVDFIDENVPDTLQLTLKVQDLGKRLKEEPVSQVWDDLPEHKEPEFFVEFSFLLHFDPQFTGLGRTVELNKTVDLDGQMIHITDMEIYPTHIRINVQEDERNDAWLESLRFYLELENGFRVETISNGISATGSPDTPSMVSYRAESSFFYEADCIRLYITGADFLDKDWERITINLETLEVDFLPQGVQLHKAERKPSGWEVTFLYEPTDLNHVQILRSTYYDLKGTEYHCGSWGSGSDYYFGSEDDAYPKMNYETYYLEDFHESIGVFSVNYTHFWETENPVIVELTGK